MTHVFLHAAGPGQCRAIIGQRSCRPRRGGGEYPLAIICAAPVAREGAAWCAAHAALYTRPAPARIGAPRETIRIARAPAGERPEPDLCALVGGGS